MTKITVILPNYNKQLYIKACLDSLLAQSYPHWQCWIVDGYSDDGSAEILSAIAQADSRFCFSQLARTGNCYDAWNWGLSQVNTPYFVILTSDDRLHPQWFELAMQGLAQYPTAIAAASAVEIIDSIGKPQGQTAIARRSDSLFDQSSVALQFRSGQLAAIVAYFMGAIYSSFHSLLLRSQSLARGFDFATNLGAIADYDSYLRLALMGDFIYLPQIVNQWRQYPEQLTALSEPSQLWQDLATIHHNIRPAIAQSLGLEGKRFDAIAQVFDRQTLPYSILRPSLKRLLTPEISSKLEFISMIRQYPREFVLDCTYRLRGEQSVLEAGAKAVEQIKPLVDLS